MRIKIQLTVETEGGEGHLIEEIATLERAELKPETVGLSLAEAKTVLAALQNSIVSQQLAEYVQQPHYCKECGEAYALKGQHQLVFRTLFGKLKLASPRFYTCACQSTAEKKSSFSPLATLLPERSAPEFIYLQSKWAALMSYGLTASLLEEVLPLEKPLSLSSLTNTVHQVAERSENELGPEKACFIEGCEAEWNNLPTPAPPLMVGIDGGYVHAREGDNRKAGWFEVIVGKSIPTEGAVKAKTFGFVNDYDKKPKRRLYEVLRAQGMQNNQQVTFISDGGDNVRNIQRYLNPEVEFLLDWFHLTMRLTVLGQLVKGLATGDTSNITDPTGELDFQAAETNQLEPDDFEAEEFVYLNESDLEAEEAEEDEEELEDDEVEYPSSTKLAKELTRVKWYLWHGNVFKAMEILEEDLEFELEPSEIEEDAKALVYRKILKALREFTGYIRSNQAYIINYGDRYRNGERISSGFAESTVNQVVSKRFVKKQQMRWNKRGVHLLLQVRTKVLNGELEEIFQRWYPAIQFSSAIELDHQKKAA